MSKSREKLKDYKKMDEDQLQNEVRSLKQELRALRFNMIAGKVKDISEVSDTKKNIARVETILKAKQINKK